MKKYDRVFLLVIDSLGIGQDDTSKEYGDVDVDTLLHISESVDSLKNTKSSKIRSCKSTPNKTCR